MTSERIAQLEQENARLKDRIEDFKKMVNQWTSEKKEYVVHYHISGGMGTKASSRKFPELYTYKDAFAIVRFMNEFGDNAPYFYTLEQKL